MLLLFRMIVYPNILFQIYLYLDWTLVTSIVTYSDSSKKFILNTNDATSLALNP